MGRIPPPVETPILNPHSLDSLVSPYGVVSRTWNRGDASDDPMPFASAVALAGSGRPGWGGRGPADHTRGGGRSWDSPEAARFIAIAEAAERYAGVVGLGEERIVATAADLAGECLEPHRYPRCSQAEYARPGCPVIPFPENTPIRWSQGLDLATWETTWVPTIMVCYGLRGQNPLERFTVPISTGYSVHTDPVRAVIGGICEIVERDALSVTWLQRLPLSVINESTYPERLHELIEWNRRRFIRAHLFDATFDLGVPTAYCVLAADHDPSASRLVGAATADTLGQAAEKALAEAQGIRVLFHRTEDPVPHAPEHFSAIEDGARFMGLPHRAGAFDFLLRGANERPTMPPRGVLPADPRQALAELVGRLDAAGMRVVVVDRTPSELSKVGLTAVSVVIPDLQPFSPQPLAQFKAHPRLYELPERMGYPVLAEEQLNSWPQPFA